LDFSFETLRESPYPIAICKYDKAFDGIVDREFARSLSKHWEVPLLRGGLVSFRGVDISRLSTVLKTGIDVEPSNSVIYASDLKKSLEYGGSPKLILALDSNRLKKTYVETNSDIPEAEISRLRETYPTMLRSEGGASLWFSRMDQTDTRLATPYESEYAWWIEQDHQRALKGLLLLCEGADLRSESYFRTQLSKDVST
jgi:hypothetical protein